MARNAVAEIVAPGQRGRRAVGEIVEPGEIAADAADRDADRERQREARAGAGGDMGAALVELDRQDAARDGALDRAGDAGFLAQPQIGGAQHQGADPGAEQQHRDVAPVARRHRRELPSRRRVTQ